MSRFTKIRDKYIKVATGGLINPERRHETRNMIKDQVKAYEEQTNIARDQLNAIRNQQDVEKKRIEQKQIRALRRNYRSANVSLLGMGAPGAGDMSTKLGG